MDGDGNVEIIGSVTWGGPQGYQYGNIYQIYSHNGDYNFQDVTQNFIENYSQQKAIYRIRLQDIDNNGKIDLINDFKESSDFQYMLFDGNGTALSL